MRHGLAVDAAAGIGTVSASFMAIMIDPAGGCGNTDGACRDGVDNRTPGGRKGRPSDASDPYLQTDPPLGLCLRGSNSSQRRERNATQEPHGARSVVECPPSADRDS